MNRITDEQKHQQQEAAYGLPPVPTGNFTHEQIEGMRRFVQQHDAQNANIMREFDLNKPPMPPYRYQEFPRMLYRDGKTAVVKDQIELEGMLAHGWSKTPSASMEVNLGGELSAEMRAEAAAIDAQLRQPSRTDLEREIEKLRAENAGLKNAAETSNSELTEEQKRSKRSADAANAARARWEKREQAPESSAPAVEDALPA